MEIELLKSGDATDITNYRPISISCACAKIFDRLLYNRIFEQAKSKISNKQHGFYTGRSTLTNFLECHLFLTGNVMNGGQVDTVYTDITKAFDQVNDSILLKKLRTFGIGPNLIEFVKSYLENRTQVVVIGGVRSMNIKST